MHTSDHVATIGRQRRRRHSAAFKAESVAACEQPGVSIAAVAMSRSLNANLLRRWVLAAEQAGALPPPTRSECKPIEPATAEAFVPVRLARRVGGAEAPIRIDLRQGSTRVRVSWPVTAASECALWLRELMR